MDIGNTEIGTETLIALATVLNSNATLLALNLENPRVFSKTEDSTYQLARMLQVNRTLRYLNLGKHGMRDYGAQMLAEHLAENSSLVSLDLRANSIAGVGGEALAGLLLRGSPIVELNLENNRITDDGACALEQALRRNVSLQVLNITNNSIKDKGLTALAGALEENKSLRAMKIWVCARGWTALLVPLANQQVSSLVQGNHFDKSSLAAFLRLFETRFPYTGFEIDITPYVVDGEVQMAKAD